MKKLLLILFSFLIFGADAFAEETWYKKNSVSIHYGKGLDSNLSDIAVGKISETPYRMISLSYTSVIDDVDSWFIFNNFLLEREFLIAHHFESQYFMEYVAAMKMRFYKLPWNEYFDSSLAFSFGLSIADEVPELETERVNNFHSEAMFYLGGEFGVVLPKWNDMELVFKIHHRSGAWGTIDGVTGGSNYFNIGLRYNF